MLRTQGRLSAEWPILKSSENNKCCDGGSISKDNGRRAILLSPMGLYIIRGDNVGFIGELDLEREELPSFMVSVTLAKIKQAVKGLPTRLGCRQYGQECRSFLLVCGARARDACAIKSPWPIYPSFSILSSSHEQRSIGQVGYSSSYSSVWKKPSSSVNALVESSEVQQLWEEYFADPSRWWDNRIDKRNFRSPDFKHKETRKALWLDGLSTPAWVKARLQSVTQSHAGYVIRESQASTQENSKPPKGNYRSKNNLPRESKQVLQGGGDSMPMQRAKFGSEEIVVLKNHVQQDIAIDSYMSYVKVLKRCLKRKDLTKAKQVHECIIKSGMEQNTYVANNLLNVYITCGRLQDARQVFDKLVRKNVFSWTIMIGGYAQHNCCKDAMELFNRMRQDGVQPNATTYGSILKACASPVVLKWGKEVHEYIRRDGLESDVRVGTALVQMYAKCGCIMSARQAFEKVSNQNVISWTTMIGAYTECSRGVEAYELFLQMQREGCVPNAITYLSILNPSASAGALQWVKGVHSHALKAGLESDLSVGNALIHMYAKSGSIDDARQVFDRMKKRNVITWTVMIGGLAQHGCGHEAYDLFLQMQREGCVPNAITYLSILNASASSASALQWVKGVHSHALEAGLESDLSVGNALIHMYAKSGSIDDARQVFDRMKERDVITWTSIIGTYAESGCGKEAYELFLQMKREGFNPDAITYISILNASASWALEWVKEVHSHVLDAGLESDVRVGNALVHMYAKSGSIDDAQLVFERMPERNVVTWNTMIGGLAQHGRGREALHLFRNMIVKPDGYSFVAVLSACSHAGLLEEGRRLFLAMSEEHGMEPSVLHCNCMVDLLGRAGHLEEAKLFIRSMPCEPNEATWGALLGACRTHGNVEMAEQAAQERIKLDPDNAATYVLLSNIYAAAGKWEEVSLVRTIMQERGVRKEPGCTWIEVDNKIHEFVVKDKSHPEAEEIYAELNRLSEIIKAAGYVPDTRLVLENIGEEEKELALCSHSEKLAIAYGLMRTPCGEPIRVYKNLRVCSDCHTATKFISKVTRREIMARDANRFHHFKYGVCSCGDYW